MSGLETAIRNALERGDRSNAEVRARIYQSARQALEAGLRKQDVNDPETVALQRQRLEVTIRQIEGEERARLHAAASPTVEPVISPGDNDRPQGRPAHLPAVDMDVAPERREPLAKATDVGFGDVDMRADRSDRFAAEPTASRETATGASHVGGLDVKPETVAHRRRRRAFFPRLFMFSVLFAALGIGIWWVYTSGLLLTAEQRDTSVANPPARVDAEDFNNDSPSAATGSETGGLRTLGPKSGFSDDWLEVFTPGDAASATARSKGAVDMVSGGDGQMARITSSGADDLGAVEIAIPADVLKDMAGKTSTIALTVQTEPDKPTQISVQCDFGSLGDCERHRFSVTNEKSDVLFQVSFDRSLAPNAAGRLLINSDVEGKGRSVNLYAVRVLPGQ